MHALDYLLKPFDRERFYSTLERARDLIERQRAGDLGQALLAMVQDLDPRPAAADRLVVKSAGESSSSGSMRSTGSTRPATTCACT